MSKGIELVKNTGIIAIGKCGVLLIQFFLLPIYTSYLSTAEYGSYDYLVTIGLFVIPIATMLMEESMFRFLIDAKNEKEESSIISTTIIYIIVSNLIIGFLIFILCKSLSYNYIFYLILYIISGSLYNLILGLARGKGNIKFYSIISLICTALTVGLNLLFIVVLNLGLNGIMISVSIAQFFCFFLSFIVLNMKKYLSMQSFNLCIMKSMFKFSLPLVPNSVSWSFVNLLSRTAIVSFIGVSANGIYSIANKFPYLINVVYGFFYTAWRESAAKAFNEEDKDNFYQSIYVILKRFMFSICIVLIAFLPFVFDFFVDKDYASAYYYIPPLIISMYYANVSGFYGGIYSAYKQTNVMGLSAMIGAILTVVATLVLIPFMGIWAAVVGNFLSNFTTYIIRKIDIKKYIIFDKDLRFEIFKLIWLAGVLFCYYSSNIILLVLALGISIILSFITNRQFVKVILNFIKNHN